VQTGNPFIIAGLYLFRLSLGDGEEGQFVAGCRYTGEDGHALLIIRVDIHRDTIRSDRAQVRRPLGITLQAVSSQFTINLCSLSRSKVSIYATQAAMSSFDAFGSLLFA
jgi:hypothetical protein